MKWNRYVRIHIPDYSMSGLVSVELGCASDIRGIGVALNVILPDYSLNITGVFLHYNKQHYLQSTYHSHGST